MTLNVQMLTMLTMLSGGFYLGIAQDTYRRLTRRLHQGQFIHYVTEVAFWLTQSLLLFYALFLVNNGEIRVYVLLACFLGYSAYRALAAGIYKRILERVLHIFNRVILFISKVVDILIVKPVKSIVRLMVVSVMSVLNGLLAILSVILKIVYWPLSVMGRLLYRLSPDPVRNFFHTIARFCSTMKKQTIKIIKAILNKWRS